MIPPIIIKIIPNNKTLSSKFIIIKIEVMIPRQGKTGNFPIEIGIRNPSTIGFLYLKYITAELTDIKTAKIVKFVKFAIVCKSSIKRKNIEEIIITIIATYGVFNFV